jgi:hypothetical protein
VQTAIWLHAWDLEGWEPAAFVDRLRAFGLDACHLALAYHATRMTLPAHRRRRVFETARSAAYFPIALEGVRVAPESALTPPFLDACRDASFPVRAWLVLCHQDGAAGEAGDAAQDSARCIANVYGDRYAYAWCPSQPDVQAWAGALCTRAAALPGVDALDIEAASFLGVDHQSAHDKRGVPLPPAIAWLLSICVCDACRRSLGAACAEEIASRARHAIDTYLQRWPETSVWSQTSLPEALAIALGEDLLRDLLDARERAQVALLTHIRRSTPGMPLLVRLASSRFFIGGKTALPPRAIAPVADAAVMTWLGADLAAMKADLDVLPPPAERDVPLHGGFTLHAPDCRASADVDARLGLLQDAGMESAIAYCYGLASDTHLAWLRDALVRRRIG